MPDLGTMITGGARYAQAMREAEAFKLQKEDREYARQQKEKQEEFARRSRELSAAVQNAEDPKEKSAAYTALATHSPEDARALQKFETAQSGALLEQQAEQFALQNKQALDAAHVWKPIIEGINANPDPATFETAFRSLQAAQSQGAQVEPKMIAQLLDPQRRQELLATANDTIMRLSPAPKAGNPFRPGAPSLEQLNIFTTLAAKEGIAVPEGLLTVAAGPEIARQSNPKLWARAGALLDEASRAKGTTNIKVDARPPGVEDPTSRVKGALQEETMRWASIGREAKRLHDTVKADPSLLGDAAQAKQWGYELRARKAGLAKWVGADIGLDEEQSAWLENRRGLITEGVNNLYTFIVMMSGKAVTEGERAVLLEGFGDVQKMSDVEYRGIMKTLNGLAIREQKLRRDFMQGFDTRSKAAREWWERNAQEIVDQRVAGDITVKGALARHAALIDEFKLRFSDETGDTNIPGIGDEPGSDATDPAETASPSKKIPGGKPASGSLPTKKRLLEELRNAKTPEEAARIKAAYESLGE